MTTIGRLRRLLLITLIIGVTGMATELLLIGHFEDPLQLIPLTVLAAGLVVLVWYAVRPTATGLRVLRVVMLLFVVSGGAGLVLHYRGNQAFELEMYPSMGGVELVQKTLTGATPVLAPGSMALLGLVGWTMVLGDPLREHASVGKEHPSSKEIHHE